MKCKNCKREIDDDSIFCKWCGQRQIKEAKQEIRIPEPRQKPSGKWYIQLRLHGVSHYILEDTEAKCRARAVAVKSGILEQKKRSDATLRAACDRYIADRSNTLSPSTIRGYRIIQNNRLQSVMDVPISSVTNWQRICNREAEQYSEATVRNTWAFIRRVLKNEGITAEATMPKPVKTERPWLTPEQIPQFIELIHGSECEIPALLALHSLRRSELAALTWDNVDLDTLGMHKAKTLEIVQKTSNFKGFLLFLCGFIPVAAQAQMYFFVPIYASLCYQFCYHRRTAPNTSASAAKSSIRQATPSSFLAV